MARLVTSTDTIAELPWPREVPELERRPPGKLLASGLVNKQGAHQLSINEVTVKVHSVNAMRKLTPDPWRDPRGLRRPSVY